MHHDPEEQKLHLRALLEQKGAGVCSLMWWLHWEMLPAAAAAAQCLLSPGGQRCAVVFGHPKHTGNSTSLHEKTRTGAQKICPHSVTSQNPRWALTLLRS